MTDKFGWFVAIFIHSPPYDYVLKIEQEGHLWCTRTVKITLQFQHTPVHPVQCAWESDWAKFEPPWTILADSTAMARCTTAQKCWQNRKIGSRGGIGMGSKSGWAHALGCPEWVPPGAGSREGVLGTLWWFPCPSGPILAIHADTDQICTHTYRYIEIPTHTYILETAKYLWR